MNCGYAATSALFIYTNPCTLHNVHCTIYVQCTQSTGDVNKKNLIESFHIFKVTIAIIPLLAKIVHQKVIIKFTSNEILTCP